MDEIRRAFELLGATVESSVDQTEGEIDGFLRRWLVDEPGPAGVTVVHLIGHGRTDRSGRLSFVARDDREVDVYRWIEKAQQEVERDGNRQRVVFLVDTCSAGAATGRQPISELNGSRGVWALGASPSTLPTEQGRFSHWIATALNRVRGYDFTLNDEAVKFTAFVRELIQVARRDVPSWRMSLGFSLEQGDGDWPFLPNPRTAGLTAEQLRMRRRSLGYVPGEEELRKDLGARIAAGEEIADAVYFHDRASGRGLVSAGGREGFFSGRAAELKRYMEWQAGDGPLMTVTGAAGAGKSGLLGVIVCAAHPELRGNFHELWADVEPELPEVPDVVAVHARQRSVEQLLDTIVRLTGLTPPLDEDEDVHGDERDTPEWTADLLRKALDREQKHRLLVLDAVDESTDPQAVLDLVADLIAPKNQRDAAAPAPCRILLGGRREVINGLSAIDRMTRVAVDRIDLDTADPAAVEEDVRQYIARLLVTSECYATGPASEFVGVLAKQGAERIVRGMRPDSQWGPFLLAGLYAHYLMTLENPPRDPAAADAYANRVSANLPDLLEAVLKARAAEHPALRAVLAVLARSKGDGMPRVTLRRCLRALNADGITEKELDETLREASPFLRTGVDRESKTLYRIFQQGLADYLRDRPVSRDPVDEAGSLELERKLLAEIVGPFMGKADSGSPDRWYAAEPYVLQHALGHVMAADSAQCAEELLSDPYFLIRFDPRQDHRAIDLCRSERADEYLRLLSASWPAHGKLRGAADRASVFAFDSDRLGLLEHRRRFALIAKEVAFQPEDAAHSLLWAAGGHVDSSSQFIETAATSVGDLTFSPDGGLLAVATYSGVHVLETETWQQVSPLFGTTLGNDFGLWASHVAFSPDGRRLALAGATWSRNIQLWDVQNRVLIGRPWSVQTGAVKALAFSPDSRRIAVGSSELGISVWDVGDDEPVELARPKDSDDPTDVQFSPDGRFLAMCGPRGVILWETKTWEPLPLSTDEAYAIAYSADARLLAAACDDYVVLWSCDAYDEVRRIPMSKPSSHLAFSADGSLLATASWGSLRVLDAASGDELSCLIEADARIVGVAFHPLINKVLVSGDFDGHLRVWKGFGEEKHIPQLTRFDSDHATVSPDGRLVAAIDKNERRLTLRDATTGTELGSFMMKEHDVDLHFSPDSHALVTVSYRKPFLQVVRTGSIPFSEPVAVPLGGNPILSSAIVFSHDSRLFALVVLEPHSEAWTLKVWDLQELRLTTRIPLPGPPDTFGFAGPDKLLVGIDGALAVYAINGSETAVSPE
ncbi:AAA family ATPase [Streptomyces coeruleorubidus]|uniref:AAA family ATPase n=1 Tax=Streptomyces coeruleorubidus TaxID=116188 RepID=UPI0033AE9365